MPSGRTHDAITFALAAPVFAATYLYTSRMSAAALVAVTFIFGGLMFGPDLDTGSRQYSRWWIFRPMWLPYRGLFRHRSRFSHGLVFGSFIRVVYFHAIIVLTIFLGIYAWAGIAGGHLPASPDLIQIWRRIDDSAVRAFGEYSLILAFVGAWIGAASHTFTDIAGSYIKTGRVGQLF